MKKLTKILATMMALVMMLGMTAGTMEVHASELDPVPGTSEEPNPNEVPDPQRPTGGFIPLEIVILEWPEFMVIYDEPAKEPEHTHSYVWKVVTPATEGKEGLSQYICSTCGHVEGTQAVSTATAFVTRVIDKIKAAPDGSTVELDAGVWRCYTDKIMQEMKKHNVNLKTTYMENGVTHSFTIPAKEIPSGEQFYGFTYLFNKYGK